MLLCFQTPFTYGIGKGEASSVFCVLHYMEQAVSTGSPPLETEKLSLGGGRAAFLNGGSIPLRYGQILVNTYLVKPYLFLLIGAILISSF